MNTYEIYEEEIYEDEIYEETRKMLEYFNQVEKIEVPKIFNRPLDIK